MSDDWLRQVMMPFGQFDVTKAIIVVLKEITKKALHSRTFFASFDRWSKLSLGALICPVRIVP